MNKNEAEKIAQFLSELIETPTENFYIGACVLRDNLSEISPTFRSSYQSWKDFWEEDRKKHEEFDRRMAEKYEDEAWALLKSANTPEAKEWRHKLWVEIFGEDALDFSDDER